MKWPHGSRTVPDICRSTSLVMWSKTRWRQSKVDHSSSSSLLLNEDRKALEAHEYCMMKHAKFATHRQYLLNPAASQG